MKPRRETMKNLLIGLLILASLIGLSCQSTPPETASVSQSEQSTTPTPTQPPTNTQTTPTVTATPVIVGAVTQQKIDEALNRRYEAYRSKLDLTGAQNYTVVWGDTLSQITRSFYGSLTNVGVAGTTNGFYFPVLMLTSDTDIVDPDLIEPGMVLTVPDLRRNLNNPTARQAIKDFLNDVAYIYNRKNLPLEEAGLKRLSNSL
jgi:hypothetical protein